MIFTSKYPWDNWLDGRVWLLRAHHDYACLNDSMRSGAHARAKALGVALATRDVGLGVLVQAYPIGSTWRPNLQAISPSKIKNAAMENKR